MKVDEVPGELDSDPLVVPFRQNSPNVGPIPSPYYMNKTTTSPHSCTSHRRAAAHRRAGGKRALRLLIFRFWVDFEEIYLYFVPPRGPAPRISPSAVTAGHEAAFHIGAPRGVRGPDGACFTSIIIQTNHTYISTSG